MQTAWWDTQRARVVARIVAAAIPGLYAGRLLCEAVRPGVAGAILITFAAVLGTVALAGRRPLIVTWPGLLLLVYVLYPEADPRYGLAAALLTGTAAAMWHAGGKAPTVPAATTSRTSRRFSIGLPLLVAAAFTLLYVNTLAPGVLPADSGEMQLVAAELGVAHPPGFPLYTLLAHLMTRLPLAGGPAYAVNLLSALISALTLALVCGTAGLFTGSRAAGVLTAAALGLSTTFWAQATTANIRTLTAFFAALALYALARLWRLKAGAEPQEGAAVRRRLFVLLAVALAFGIAHHASLAFMALVFVAFAGLTFRDWLGDRKLWAAMAMVALAALLPIVYLPLRGATGAVNAPADLATLPGLLNHVLARGFRGDLFYFTAPGDVWARLKVMAGVMAFQFDPILLAGMLIGAGLLLWRERRLAGLLIGSFALHTLVTATYRAPQTVEYMLPAYVPAALALAFALGRPAADHRAGRLARALLGGLVAVALFRQLTTNLPSYELLSHREDARDYAQTIMREAPAGGLVLADWHWATPLWYLQGVEAQRPDLEIRYVFPGAGPYAATWAEAIGTALADGREVVATHFDEAAYRDLPQPRPLGEAFLYAQGPLDSLPTEYRPADLTLGGAVAVAGFQIAPEQAAVDQETVLTLAWRPAGALPDGLTLFAHLVSQEGVLAASQDIPAAAQPDGLTLTQFRLTPRPGTPPGSLTVLVGAYAAEPPSDPATELAELALTAAALPRWSAHATHRPLAGDGANRTLIGYDWDNTVAGRGRLYLHWREGKTYPIEVLDTGSYALPAWFGPWGLVRRGILEPGRPASYVPLGQGLVWTGPTVDAAQPVRPGQTLELEQRFAAGWPVQRDLVVSVRLVGYEEDGFHWAWWDLSDGIPALGAIPTLKWIGGSQVRDPHYLTVAEGATPGQEVEPLVRLYDAFTGRPVPMLDAQLAEAAPWIPAGRVRVTGASE